jgi:hypothetical protein
MLYLYQQSRDHEERYETKSINSIYYSTTVVEYPEDLRNSNLFLRAQLTLKPKEYVLKEQRPRMLYLYQQS